MNLFDLTGEYGLVLGSGGIGGAIARGMAEAGAEVIIADCSAGNLERTEAEIKRVGGRVHVVHADIKDKADVEALYRTADGLAPRLTLSVNSIGLNEMSHAVDTTEEQWDKVLNGFLKNLFWSNQEAAKRMLPQKKGKIVNLASMSGVIVTGDQGSSYAAAKAGVIQLTRALAAEWISSGVYVNAISPGTVDTPLTAGFLGDPASRREVEREIPIGRVAQPADMVGPALFLLSGASDYVVGHNLLVDGGYTLR